MAPNPDSSCSGCSEPRCSGIRGTEKPNQKQAQLEEIRKEHDRIYFNEAFADPKDWLAVGRKGVGFRV